MSLDRTKIHLPLFRYASRAYYKILEAGSFDKYNADHQSRMRRRLARIKYLEGIQFIKGQDALGPEKQALLESHNP